MAKLKTDIPSINKSSCDREQPSSAGFVTLVLLLLGFLKPPDGTIRLSLPLPSARKSKYIPSFPFCNKVADPASPKTSLEARSCSFTNLEVVSPASTSTLLQAPVEISKLACIKP